MSKKNKTQKKNEPRRSPFSALKQYFRDERLRFFLGVSCSLLTIYLSIAFISFFFTGGADQSKLDIKWIELIINSQIHVENWTGKTGAFLSNLFINKWFGLASFSFLYLLVIIALRLFSVKIHSLTKSIRNTLIISIWLSITLAYFCIDSYNDSYLFMGGAHGFFISQWLNALFGKVGTFLIIILSVITFLLFGTKNGLELMKTPFRRKEKKTPVQFNEESSNSLQDEDEQEMQNQQNKPDLLLNNQPNATTSTEQEVEQHPPFISNLEEELSVDQQTEIESNSQELEIPVPKNQTNNNNNSPEHDLELTIETHHQKEETVTLSQRPMEDYDPTMDLSKYKLPPLNLLEDHNSQNSQVSKEELETNKDRIVQTLRNYKIEIIQIKATIGPTVTLYEIVPAPGIRISKIKNLEDDIALSLSALGIRIIAPIPGRGTIGIEVPNRSPEIVSMRSIIASRKFQESKYALPVAMGKTISNDTYTMDLAKMPHLLVAGATGQGKSVGLNAIITSLLYVKHPSQLKFVLVDPKKVELSIYSTIEKHYLAKLPDEEEAIITDITKVIATLNSLCMEMDTRYDLLKKAHARNIKEYNAKFIKRKLNPEDGHRYLPYIVVIIDEFADLIMTAGKEVEMPIARIAQLARAIGIHMIIATQRPSTNIITGVIKANFPARIAFKVASMIDSRTILDSPGANQLIGRGDMLISVGSDLTRVQCAFVDTPEVEAITDFISHQQSYPSALLLPEYVGETSEASASVDLQKKDPLFEEAARLVVSSQQGSTSGIQRRFSIGYNRAGRIVDQLEAAGIVGPFEGSKARQVVISDEYSLEKLLNEISN